MSIGEESRAFINKNLFDKNKSAITIKDGSKAYVLSNDFINNEQDFSLYIKKILRPQCFTLRIVAVIDQFLII